MRKSYILVLILLFKSRDKVKPASGILIFPEYAVYLCPVWMEAYTEFRILFEACPPNW